jgi:hypothetical protein
LSAYFQYCCPKCREKESNSSGKKPKGHFCKTNKVTEKTLKRGSLVTNKVCAGSCVENDVPKGLIKVELNSTGSSVEEMDIVEAPKEIKRMVTSPKKENNDGRFEQREQALRVALKHAQSRGLPDGWVCIYGVSINSIILISS